MIYREIAPRKELQPYIRCFWVLEDPFCVNTAPERIVPDGRMELIFHYGSHFERLSGDGCAVQSRGIITGQIRRPLLIRPTGPIGMIAVRFFPFGFSSLFLLPSQELAENLYSCEDVLGKSGKDLEEQVLNAQSTDERVNLLEDHFLSLLAARGNYDFRIHRITRKIYELKGIASAAQAANISDVSFLSGCWSVQDGETTITESWTKPSSNLMQGIAQTKNAQNVIVEYEFLRIEKKADGTIAYTPYINGNQAPEFLFNEKLSEDLHSYRAVFVNEQNDFPKKISYSRAKSDDSQIFVRLEGTGQDGKEQVIEYPLFKADCNQAF